MNEDCLKLTTYFGERDRAPQRPARRRAARPLRRARRARRACCCAAPRASGACTTCTPTGCSALSEDLPVVSIAVDDARADRGAARAGARRSSAAAWSRSSARACSRGELGARARRPGARHAPKLTVYVGRSERVGSRPAFVAVCELLHRRGVAGATVLLGVDGTARGAPDPRAASLAQRATCRWRSSPSAPASGSPRSLPELGGLLARAAADARARARLQARRASCWRAPHELPGTRRARPGAVAEADRLQLARRDSRAAARCTWRSSGACATADAAGATCLRGVWGFHGDHAPHGDRLLQVRRHVPGADDRDRHARAHRALVRDRSTS